MPLLDHFHPPLSERRPWESFHATWCTTLADHLNSGILPSGYIALEQVHPGAPIEIDVGTFEDEPAGPDAAGPGGTATLPLAVWIPPAPPLVWPAVFPERFAVEIHSTEGARTVVACLELVSPGNKDRASKRQLFAAKCATHLARGVGLIVLDVVTSRHGNLHNELMDLLDQDVSLRLSDALSLYAVAYRPLQRPNGGHIETWPFPLAVGQPLPRAPLSLSADCCIAVDLEAAYGDACRRRRVDQVLSRPAAR
ncbi:MAG TPA: DUF4058 family protein [Gemmataceae bacterium]|nr:DUF4058 family protein [Gemmataceae bacterium]